MIDLGNIRPGRTIRIPFGSFAAATGAPTATTNYADADIFVYKDGSVTQRASAAGITATTSFDSLTGVNLITIDLSDNTTADFWAAGSEYIVVVSDITVDGQTLRFPIARFTIGYHDAVRNTTIATLASQTSFTLAAGSADNNAYVGCEVVINAAASAVQMCMGVVSAYTGSTKTVTLSVDPAIYTIAAKDNICIFHRKNVYAWNGLTTVALPLIPTTAGRTLDVSAGGEAGIDLANVGSPTTILNLSGTTIATVSGNVVGSVNNVLGGIGGSVAGDVNGQIIGSLGGSVLGSVVGSVGSVLAGVALTSGERTTLNGVIKTTAITEAYRANGAAPTEAQFICEVLAHLGETAIVTTTKTINKLDHSTPAETFTLDSATAPTSISRAT